MEVLIQQLTKCEILLRSLDEIFWADKIKKVLINSDENIEQYLLQEIISWYGGMGSFNDLVVSKYNGHNLNGRDESILNEELKNIRNAMYDEVKLQIRN